MDTPVSGHCDSRFRSVPRGICGRNFGERGEVGAAVCIVVDGVTVVDLVGGWADPALGACRPGATTRWSTTTPSGRHSWRCWRCSWSTPGCSRWTTRSAPSGPSSPPRARKGRPCGTRCVTRPACRPSADGCRNDDLWDWDRMAGALAATAPWWEPGTRHAYHTNTYGHLIGEVVRRVERRALRATAGPPLAGPLQADLFVGVPPAEQRRPAPRCSSSRPELARRPERSGRGAGESARG